MKNSSSKDIWFNKVGFKTVIVMSLRYNINDDDNKNSSNNKYNNNSFIDYNP